MSRKLTTAEACSFIFTGGRITVAHYKNLKRPCIPVFTHRAEEVGSLTEKQLNEILCSGIVDLIKTSESKYGKFENFELAKSLKTEVDYFCITELLSTLHNLSRKERNNDTQT